MIALGTVGAAVAVFGTVVGWIFVGQIASASDDSLEVTVQTLEELPGLTRSDLCKPHGLHRQCR